MGHRPPYIAVITLAVMTAHHWRTIRTKLLLAGIADPMGLRSMHMLLDTTESTIMESMSSSREKDAEFKRDQFVDRLYSPANDVSNLNGEGYVAAPAGFEPENVEAAFDAFAAATSGSAV